MACIKYLFKYVYKGHDSALFEILLKDSNSEENNSINEEAIIDYDGIRQYINTRYVSVPEAIYRIHDYNLHKMSHVIYRLAVHLENEQNVYFKEGEETQCLAKRNKTTLTAYFDLNRIDTNAKKYLYNEIPFITCTKITKENGIQDDVSTNQL